LATPETGITEFFKLNIFIHLIFFFLIVVFNTACPYWSVHVSGYFIPAKNLLWLISKFSSYWHVCSKFILSNTLMKGIG